MECQKMEKARITVPVDEEIIDLIPRYLENRWTDLRALEGALEAGDLETFRSLGHSMKGSGGGYGLDQVTDIGTGMEEAAKAQNLTAAQRWLETLRDFLERVDVVAG
jgi:HPt (histidine-containing phosphotransfer) domain-containing protein